MSRRSDSSLIGTGLEPSRASSAIATTAYRDFEVTEITSTLYSKQARIGVVSATRRCLLVGSNPLMSLAIRSLLDGEFEVERLESRREAVDLIRDVGGFQVAVIDFARHAEDGELDGPETVRAIRRAEPAIGIVACGAHPQRHMAQLAQQTGATSYVTERSQPEALRDAIRLAADQESFTDPALPPRGSRGLLTQRQRQILELLADGQSTNFAAEQLGLSEETVKTHTKNVLSRLGARNRAHAVALAIRRGLIE